MHDEFKKKKNVIWIYGFIHYLISYSNMSFYCTTITQHYTYVYLLAINK